MEEYLDSTLSPRERAADLVGRMTIREKVGQLNQRLYGFDCYERQGGEVELSSEFVDEVKQWGGLGVLYGLYRADPWSKRDFSSGLDGSLPIKAYNMAQKYVLEHSRFGIPMLLSSECPHGHQALDGYLLPVNLAMGATWNPELVRSAYEVCAKQMQELGVDLALISVLDVLRDPRWGRSEECYSEDPYLCASMAEAAVTGCREQGVSVVAKHFCAQGEGTGGINASAARIGERELREIHLPPAKAVCKAGVQGIMAAYNEIDGIPCHGNRWLLKEVLLKEMDFKGVIMADGTAIDRLDVLTGNYVKSGALALSSGVDISLWDKGFTGLEKAVEKGCLTVGELDGAVCRVLELKFERGLFENPYLEEKEPDRYTNEENPQSLELARQSVVMVKNEGVLPLDFGKVKSVAVIGPNADSLYNQLGDYTPPVREGEGITLLEGLQEIFPESVRIEYAEGCSVCGTDEAGINRAVKAAAACDVVVLALGGSSSRFSGAKFDINGAAMTDEALQMDCGEGMDCSELTLPGVQQKLAQAILDTGKPVITVLIQGRPYAVAEEVKRSSAVLCAFYPGPMGGKALAEILSGRVTPSGCLPVSIPASTGQLPVYYNYKASYEAMKYRDISNQPLFPFGYGLSYTKFEITDVQLFQESVALEELRRGAEAQVIFRVKNTGSFSGHAVPQLFIRDLEASTVRRVRELKAFTKVSLASGEEKDCTLGLKYEDLAIWDSSMNFCVEPGAFSLELMESGKSVWMGLVTVTG
jgi:Beta-glucosidase-related glycosidases